MSKKPEQVLWDYISKHMDHLGHFDRIESTFTVNGRPDVNYCIDECEGDIELKVYDPKRGGFILRASQNIWFKRRVAEGGNCWVMARFDYLPGGRKRYLLIKGRDVHKLAHDRSYETWLGVSFRVWDDTINWGELKELLRGKQ